MDKTHKLLVGLAQRLELPSEVLVGDPCIEIKGRNELTVVRHQGVVGYDASCIRVATSLGMLRVNGQGLRIFCMNRERIVIYGEIDAVQLREDAP